MRQFRSSYGLPPSYLLQFAAMGFLFTLAACRPELASGPSEQTAEIVSGSMAPTLVGPHRFHSCSDCGISFKYGVDLAQAPARILCLNCGHVDVPTAAQSRGTVHRGRRVTITPFTSCTSPADSADDRVFKRGDVVAFTRQDSNGSKAEVKRIVGLPGESLRIENGDIWINGDLWQKPIDQCWKSAVLVHDAAYQSPQHARWQISGAPLANSPRPACWSRAAVSEASDVLWSFEANHSINDREQLEYCHAVSRGSSVNRSMPSVIQDEYVYNQGISRLLHTVSDYFLATRITWQGSLRPNITFELPQRSRRYQIAVQNDVAQFKIDGTLVETQPLPTIHDHAHEPVAVVAVGFLDASIFLTWNGQSILRVDMADVDLRSPVSSRTRNSSREEIQTNQDWNLGSRRQFSHNSTASLARHPLPARFRRPASI